MSLSVQGTLSFESFYLLFFLGPCRTRQCERVFSALKIMRRDLCCSRCRYNFVHAASIDDYDFYLCFVHEQHYSHTPDYGVAEQ